MDGKELMLIFAGMLTGIVSIRTTQGAGYPEQLHIKNYALLHPFLPAFEHTSN